MIIRDAAADELDGLAAAVVEQPLLQRYQSTAVGLARHLTDARARGDGVIVADQDGGCLGLAWFLVEGTLGAGGYLKLIALVPGHERRGVGGALLDEVERRVALRSRSLFLLVSHWNSDARRFYALRGYAEVGQLPAFVRADTDEIICHKRLR